MGRATCPVERGQLRLSASLFVSAISNCAALPRTDGASVASEMPTCCGYFVKIFGLRRVEHHSSRWKFYSPEDVGRPSRCSGPASASLSLAWDALTLERKPGRSILHAPSQGGYISASAYRYLQRCGWARK